MKLRDIIFLFCLPIYLTFSSQSVERQREDILIKVAIEYSNYYASEIQGMMDAIKEIDSVDANFLIYILEEKDYRGHKMYTILHMELVNSKYSRLPTKIVKFGDRYIAFKTKGQKSLAKNLVPSFLFTNYAHFSHETSWTVMMCKNSTKYIVVKNENAEPYEHFPELQNFNCSE